jgi:hypothetical protein
MFAAIALAALVLCIIVDRRSLNRAREHYHIALQAWQSDITEVDSVIAASKELMTIESSSMWISNDHARLLHVRRLNNVLRWAEAIVSTVPRDSKDFRMKECNRVREEIAMFATSKEAGRLSQRQPPQ